MTLKAPQQQAAATGSAASSGTIASAHDARAETFAVILGALASDETRLTGFRNSDDMERTLAAMTALGARFDRRGDTLVIRGTGNGCLLAAPAPLDFGTAGSALLLVMGLAGAYDMDTSFAGADALADRSFADVLDALRAMGVQVAAATDGGRLPVTLHGPRMTAPIAFRAPPGAGPDVAAAVLLAGLNTPGTTTVIEPVSAPETLSGLLRSFGASVTVTADADGFRHTRVEGQGNLAGQVIGLPGSR